MISRLIVGSVLACLIATQFVSAQETKSELKSDAETTVDLKKENQFSNSSGMQFLRIPGGEFRMGMTDEEADRLIAQYGLNWSSFEIEKPAHQVRLANAFFLGKYEVTVGQFRQFVETGLPPIF